MIYVTGDIHGKFEQSSEEIKKAAEHKQDELEWKVDVVLSHVFRR